MIKRLAMLGFLALSMLAAPPAIAAETILFVGNSFTFGAASPVWKYRADSVTDLNGGGVGGVPALVRTFAEQAGLDYRISLETVGGSDLALHLDEKTPLLDRSWDHVVLQSYSTIDRERPGDPRRLVESTRALARMFRTRNPKARLWLMATWSRADQTYPESGHWHGRPIDAMARDVRAAYDAAAAATPAVEGVIPVGEAWNRAFATGVADANPYDGVERGKLNLWAHDDYHASAFGYYLEALVVFGRLTGRDPRILGASEKAGSELGFSAAQVTALQEVAYDTLAAERLRPRRTPSPR
jgi:hypothetical protein